MLTRSAPPVLAPQLALAAVYDQVTDAVSALDDGQLRAPTRCPGWSAAELLLHLLLDAQRALVTLASPTEAPATASFASYWQDHRSDADPDGAAAHAEWVRRSAAAYRDPRGIVRHWCDTAPAAGRAAGAAPLEGRVATQGHVLAVPDFLTTLVVEASVHYLDLAVAVPDPAPLAAEAEALTHATLTALLQGVATPASWDDEQFILKCTGRLPLSDGDRAALATAADRFPVLG
ncbi:maleylpyruvate isomerase N-terminal domain-containing protein [Streptacidiphilus monticola]|uniref:Maleylpyruvate isomerase N-terminal domain-containing protein n=1 Tax=Streptacidiphilus monticola TaxID=2161674 RepID=A0ABW1G4E3_9ACTN